ncbi:MAG TPA: ABC transporter substrate-binding protein [Sphingomonadaceae bacterium]|nr:ABC transporter substrate-binding protein [Sphingomonadaceae bacterium]
MVRSIALFAAAFLAGCSAQSGDGGAAHPTIVSLNPCSDAILTELAVPGQLLAISHYSHDPRASSMDLAEARHFPVTGGTVEEVLALAPDVVVAGSFLQPATRNAFERFGIKVATFAPATNVGESLAQVRELAAIAGQPAQGEALVGRIENALAQAAPSATLGPIETLVWQQGGIVAGQESLMADLLARTGFANHAAAQGLGQGAYLPLEALLAEPPQLVLATGDDRSLAHPALRGLRGVRYERLDPALLYCGGPTIIRTAGRLAEIWDSVR